MRRFTSGATRKISTNGNGSARKDGPFIALNCATLPLGVFTEPVWQMLDDLQRAGFKSAEIGFCYDPFQGIVSSNSPTPQNFMWPVIFRARR